MQIQITTSGGRLTVKAPFHPAFPKQARNLDGNFDRQTETWVFDPRDEQRVRDLLMQIYGTDGTAGAETVTARVDLHQAIGQRRIDEFWLFGRRIASRRERDAPVRLGEGVVLLSGGFPSSGGSRANVDLEPQDGTVVEVRDVPAGHADLDDEEVTVVDDATEALRAERAGSWSGSLRSTRSSASNGRHLCGH